MANAIDGIGQINVSSLVSQLMSVETGQQDKLRTQQSAQTGILTAYKLLNTGIKSVLSASESIIGSVLVPKPWTSFSVSSSATTVSGSATSSAISGTYSFDVTQTASAQKTLYGATISGTTVDNGDGTFTTTDGLDVALALTDVTLAIGGGAAEALTVPDDGWTLKGLVTAINASGTGVKASAIKVADNDYRLQLIGTKTGADNSFALGGSDLSALGTAQNLQDAKNAVIQFGPGVGDTVESASNTFSNVFPGVTFTVSKVEQGATAGTGVTLTVGDNSSGMSKQVQDLVDAMNSALNTMKSQTSYDADTKKGGPLLGDSLPTRLSSVLMNAVMATDTGTTLKSVGIETTKDGTLKFDSAAFTTYLQSNPDEAKALVEGFANRVATAAKTATDFSTGTITLAINGRQSMIDDITDSIAKWDDRLAAMKARYEKQFSALNTTLTNMNNQYSALAGQMNALTGSSSS